MKIEGPIDVADGAFAACRNLREIMINDPEIQLTGCPFQVAAYAEVVLPWTVFEAYGEGEGDPYQQCASALFGDRDGNISVMRILRADGSLLTVRRPALLATPVPTPVIEPTPNIYAPKEYSVSFAGRGGDSRTVTVMRGSVIKVSTDSLTYYTVGGTTHFPPRHAKYNSFYTNLNNSFEVNTSGIQGNTLLIQASTLSYTRIPVDGSTCYLADKIVASFFLTVIIMEPTPVPSATPAPTPTPTPPSADLLLEDGLPSYHVSGLLVLYAPAGGMTEALAEQFGIPFVKE